MNHKAFQHINEFIKERFKAYYDILNKTLMRSNVLPDVYEKFGNDGILSGEADEYLMLVISDYLRENFIEDLEVRENFKAHIRYVVTHEETILSHIMQDEALTKVVDSIYEHFSEEQGYSVELDGKILNLFKKYVSKIETNLNEYVDDVLMLTITKINSTANTYNYLKNELLGELLENYAIDSILDGSLDDEIIKRMDQLVLFHKDKITVYIRNFIDSLDFPYNISESLVIDDVKKRIFDFGTLDLNDLYSGKLNSYIIERGTKLKENKGRVDSLTHIYNILYKNMSGNSKKEELVSYSREIFDILTVKYNYSPRSIIAGGHDELILKIYHRLLMKKNSVVDKKNPKKIKHETKKKKINPTLRWLLILTLLIGMSLSSISIYNAVDYGIASSKVSDFDGYNYTSIYAIDNDRVEPTGENAYEFYKKVVSAGFNKELYGYLSFYKAYNLVHQDRLYIMDKIMLEARVEASKYGDEVSKDFAEELADCSCFLEFAMRRLEFMGCDDITKAKYREALNDYENAIYLDGKPMNNISEQSKKVIEEIMSLYRKYCKERINTFGDLLGDADNMSLYVDSSFYDQSRRGK